MMLKTSPGNIKMGAITSVSMPSLITCRNDCECNKLCYGNKIERLRPSVRNAYRQNLELLQKHPETFWREVEAVIMMERFFRFHVSGDIPDADYFRNMCGVASRQPHCQILCFTKKYEIVNSYLASGEEIPDNLHVIFSGWRYLKMDNPYNLPEAHVLYKDGTTTANETAILCTGNCSNCARQNGGCWSLKAGQQILLKQH